MVTKNKNATKYSKKLLAYAFVPIWIGFVLLLTRSELMTHIIDSLIINTKDTSAGNTVIYFTLFTPIALVTFFVTYSIPAISSGSTGRPHWINILARIFTSLCITVVTVMVSWTIFIRATLTLP